MKIIQCSVAAKFVNLLMRVNFSYIIEKMDYMPERSTAAWSKSITV
jgi:hypothetical protein